MEPNTCTVSHDTGTGTININDMTYTVGSTVHTLYCTPPHKETHIILYFVIIDGITEVVYIVRHQDLFDNSQ
jgi:hypothetical protein